MTDDRNLQWLRNLVADKIRFDSSAPDQDFAGESSDVWKPIDTAINEAYSEEVTKAKLNVDLDRFVMSYTFTWASTVEEYTLPAWVLDRGILRLDDETGGVPGQLLLVRPDEGLGGLHWRSRDTIRWGTSGPGSDRTIRVRFLAGAYQMSNPLDVPWLIPYDHRWLLVWAACCILRLEADEDKAPRVWMERRDSLRQDYHLLASRGQIALPYSPGIRETTERRF